MNHMHTKLKAYVAILSNVIYLTHVRNKRMHVLKLSLRLFLGQVYSLSAGRRRGAVRRYRAASRGG